MNNQEVKLRYDKEYEKCHGIIIKKCKIYSHR